MRKAERDARDERALRMHLTGASYQQIATAVGLASKSSAHRSVQAALAQSARRDLLKDQAMAMYVERMELLLSRHMPMALKGDHKSAEFCRRILTQQARLYGLDESDDAALPPPTARPDADDDSEEPADDLARLRSRRTTG